MGWKQTRHSSQIEDHGQIGQRGRQEFGGSSAKRVHIRFITRVVKRCFWVPGFRWELCMLWRCGRAVIPPWYSVNVRDISSWFTCNSGTRRLWLCDDAVVVKQNSSQSDSRMLLGDAPKGTTRHWPTGWTQSCKWVIYGLKNPFWNVITQPQHLGTPFMNEM